MKNSGGGTPANNFFVLGYNKKGCEPLVYNYVENKDVSRAAAGVNADALSTKPAREESVVHVHSIRGVDRARG